MSTNGTRTNAFGDELTPPQEKLASCYDTLVEVLREHGDDLAPFERRGTIKAVAALWHVANGLDLEPEQLYDLGV